MKDTKINKIKIVKTSQGDIETLRSFRLFRLEFSRLHKLYDSSINAYQVTREVIYTKIKSGELKPDEPISFKSYEGNIFKISRAQSSAHNLRVQHPRYLRELIFIRLISAFEIFVIDSFKEAFLLNKKLLNSNVDSILEISENEFLSYGSIDEALGKYIERKSRNLHSQGYEEIKKFYLKNLGIDFNKSKANISRISMYHNQRHLFVHRLGETDYQYKHKYSTTDKFININEKYLLEVSKDINILAFYINEKLIELTKVT
ncbi:MAG: hypothetical protein WAX80_00370 [Minisyncoccia bacterium]